MSFDSEAIAIRDVTLLLLSMAATNPVQSLTPPDVAMGIAR
ncbi:hypothetical protein [Oscillatoria sp. HE19RPO]|nr:hypothetical protein [Oscillatoria sp. HE19RPO]